MLNSRTDAVPVEDLIVICYPLHFSHFLYDFYRKYDMPHGARAILHAAERDCKLRNAANASIV